MASMTARVIPSGIQCVCLVDDQVHAEHRRQCRDRQRDRRDHRQPLGRDGHLRVRPGLVELDRSLQIGLLAVRHHRQVVELVDSVLQQRLPVPGPKAAMVDHPAVHLAAQRGHGADRQQTVPGPEHLVEERSRGRQGGRR